MNFENTIQPNNHLDVIVIVLKIFNYMCVFNIKENILKLITAEKFVSYLIYNLISYYSEKTSIYVQNYVRSLSLTVYRVKCVQLEEVI